MNEINARLVKRLKKSLDNSPAKSSCYTDKPASNAPSQLIENILRNVKVTNLFVAAALLLPGTARAQEPSEEVKTNALKLGYILNGSSMMRHPSSGSIDVSSMTLDSPHIREIPLDKPIFPRADDPEAAAVDGPPPATSVHRKRRR
jgi:hypothetical protein